MIRIENLTRRFTTDDFNYLRKVLCDTTNVLINRDVIMKN